MDSKQKYKVIGVMSGTSLDGVDLACCSFTYKNGWQFTIEVAETIQYPSALAKKMNSLHELSSVELMKFDVAYGEYLGILCKNFINENKIRGVDFISSHGHTVFHQPENGFTTQIGNGNTLHATTGLPVVFDFRSLDVSRGGQGAPLVPAGDKFLFSEYEVCLNLGGIANLSTDLKKQRIAFDVCYANMGLNYLTQKINKKFDPQGKLANAGEVNPKLLKSLDSVYVKLRLKRPSLGREFFEKNLQPLLDNESISIKDRLRTFTESSAKEIAAAILGFGKNKTVLCTGGGALNTFLMYRLIEHCGDDATLIIPEKEIINFKEAIVFAFLGLLRTRGEANCLKSVTGATQNSSSGLMIGEF
jgi:anhydro-N-acetylmuramic acid kinase